MAMTMTAEGSVPAPLKQDASASAVIATSASGSGAVAGEGAGKYKQVYRLKHQWLATFLTGAQADQADLTGQCITMPKAINQIYISLPPRMEDQAWASMKSLSCTLGA